MGSRLDVYCWLRCAFHGHKEVGFRPDTYSCKHFLRPEMGGLQLRNLQSTSCLASKAEVTIETGPTGLLCLL